MHILFISFFLCLFGQKLYAQHPTTISKESILILPPDYSPQRSYPLLVLMPYTNGSAHDFFNKYLSEAKIQYAALSYSEQLGQFLQLFNEQYKSNESFAVLIPYGAGSRNDHSWAGFSACIERYEKRVLRDVRKFSQNYSIDTQRVYLAGVSLGGDLSWALSMRQPQFFKGAVVVGSRCSYPPELSLKHLAAKDFRFFMVMGMNEGQDRLTGMRYARQLLDSALVQYVYREMPFLEHDRAPLWLFLEGLRWTMFERDVPNEMLGTTTAYPLYEGAHSAQIDIRQYRIDVSDDLSARGDALLVPVDNTWLNDAVVNIRPDGDYFWLQLPDLPPVRLRFLSETNEDQQIMVEVLEQEISGYKYQGVAIDWTKPKWHGSIDSNSNLLMVDFERFTLKDHNRRTVYSLLIEL